jgi:hypothetical protein
MKNFTLLAGLMCSMTSSVLSFAVSANAAEVTLNCTQVGGADLVTLKIQGDHNGDTISARYTEDGVSNFGEDGVFNGFDIDGTKASYKLDGSTVILVDVSQVLGKTTQGTAEKKITGFSGGPGEAGWPDSTTDYSCVTAN